MTLENLTPAKIKQYFILLKHAPIEIKRCLAYNISIAKRRCVMSYLIIGEQIQKFRKEAGLTQKELGEAIGVSSSAVSQWETGGTPDISLLPAIADRLGVTVDALFGREKITQENMREALPRYVASLPESKRIDEICHLMWGSLKSSCAGLNDNIPHDSSIYFASNEGIMLGSAAKMSYISVFPNPENGYESFFADDEKYHRLFSILSKPNALELLKLLYRRIPKHCTAGVLAKQLGTREDETQELLSEFSGMQLVQQLCLEDEDGDTVAYIVNDSGMLVPFLYSARLIMEHFGGFHLICNQRKIPLLRNIKQGK